MNKILGILFASILLVGCASSKPTDTNLSEVAKSCTTAGGTWLAVHKECEYTSKEWCDQQEGTFNECGSACRHDPDAQMCTKQCVIFCVLK